MYNAQLVFREKLVKTTIKAHKLVGSRHKPQISGPITMVTQ